MTVDVDKVHEKAVNVKIISKEPLNGSEEPYIDFINSKIVLETTTEAQILADDFCRNRDGSINIVDQYNIEIIL